LQALIDLSPVGISVAEDPECRTVRVNRAMRDLFGLEDHQWPRGTPPFRLRLDGHEISGEGFPFSLGEGCTSRFENVETEVVFADGRHKTVLSSARPLFTTSGEVRGAIGVSTDAQASWWGGKGIGTVPHALIAAYGGDTVAAAAAFADVHYPEINVTALVDWDNDCVATSLACARAVGERLWGVRLDTSETLVDRSLWAEMGTFLLLLAGFTALTTLFATRSFRSYQRTL
jgi:hypothetical protein